MYILYWCESNNDNDNIEKTRMSHHLYSPSFGYLFIGQAISVHTIKAKCIHTNKSIHAENRYCVHYELVVVLLDAKSNRGYLCK